MEQISRQIVRILVLITITGCINRSNDEIPDIKQLWQSDEYLVEKKGNSEALLIRQAEILMERSDYQGAWSLLSREVFRLVSNPELAFLRGKAQFYLGDAQTAARYFQDARELGYSGDELFYFVAATELKLGNAKAAIESVNTLLALQQKPRFYTLKADVLLQSGDTVNAFKEYSRSIQQDSSIRNNYLGLSLISESRDELEKALQFVDKWLQRSPSDSEFVLRKANLLNGTGNYEEAGQLYASLQAAETPDILYLRSLNYLDQGKPDSAAMLANRLLLQRNDLSARLVLARSLERQRLYEEAESEYRTVYASDTTQLEAKEAIERLENRRSYLQYLRQQEEQRLQTLPPQPSRINPGDSTG